MKKLLFISAIFALCLSAAPVTSNAQTRTTTTSYINQGQFIDFGGTNLTPSDSLQVSDSLAYIIPITHNNDIDLYHTFYWSKIGAGTATLTINYLQGNDATNFFPVKKGVAQSDYTKSLTLSSSGWYNFSTALDTATVSGRYLKVQFITSSTSSVKGKIFNRVKTNIK